MYAFIPLSKASELATPSAYIVRIPVYLPGYDPDITDSNGVGIPNILELEAIEIEEAPIDALGGLVFADADLYIAYKASIAPPQSEPTFN